MMPQTIKQAIAHHDEGRLDEAEQLCMKILAAEPNNAMALHELGFVYLHQGKLRESVEYMGRAATLKPWIPEFLNNLGLAFRHLGDNEKAMKCYESAIKLRPEYAMAHFNLGIIHQYSGRPAQAEQEYRAAIQFQPTLAMAHNNFANLLKDQGRIDEAIELYRRVVSLAPDNSSWHSNLLLALNYQPGWENGHLKEHQAWARQCAAKFYPARQDYKNDSDPNRRLRIGYVSGDFRKHAVMPFFEPILRTHDRSQFEIFCYGNVAVADDMTRNIASLADQWRDIVKLSDDDAAKLIRDDRIDLLIDLSGHTAENRLLVFARKPAPVQIAYLGYTNTTGLETIQWRITDSHSDPTQGPSDHWHTEKLLRLPQAFFVYAPGKDAPEVAPSPAKKTGIVTFASMNYLAKITPQVLKLWGTLLSQAANSRLLFLIPGNETNDPRLMRLLEEAGAKPGQVTFVTRGSREKYLALYERIDILLDPFPFGGHTTTMDALWQGIPVITLAGGNYSGRMSYSVLKNLQMDQFIADSTEDYLRIARETAADIDALAQLRGRLREMMQSSYILDPQQFTRDLEAAYRQMWRMWCS